VPWLASLALLALSSLAPGSVPGNVRAADVGAAVPVEVARLTRTDVGQVIDVRAEGSYATVTGWEREQTREREQAHGAVWRETFSTARARVGANGVVGGARRRQGTSTTPSGTYRMTRAFGVGRDPGTALPYHHVTADDWWVEDPDSAYYNQLRGAAEGGFPLTESGDHASEHLIDYPVQYHNAVVVDFNTHPAVRGRGAGIFLHDLGPAEGATTGCVAVPRATLTAIMRWLDPARRPVIVIG
jgi:L,D-peptidoglycan transpeptidase YkuD (ErfK/YbiS/YcfS/YnhG family)